MLITQYKRLLLRLVIFILLTSTAIVYYMSKTKSISSKHRSNKTLENVKSRSTQNQFFVNNTKKDTKKKWLEVYNNKVYSFGDRLADIKLAVVLCGERLNQTVVTLKSAIIFSKSPLHFIIIADENNRQLIKNEILKWPRSTLNRLSFEIHPIKFPNGSEGAEWKKLFKLCACQRLFLPSILQHIDSVLYVDTDVLFMKPIADLWQYFYEMNRTHIAALCPEHEDFATGWYNRFARHPFYKPLGVNSGVMLMNLTRMRAFQWETYLPQIMKEYKLNIVWGDQDIINIIFHFHPDKLYIFPCQWNYRPDHCMYSSVCKTAEHNGIAIVHGNRGVFQNNKQLAFKAIYKIMAELKIGDDLSVNLLEPMKRSLTEASNTNCGKHLSTIFSFQFPSQLMSKGR